jgi:TolA-binding protein
MVRLCRCFVLFLALISVGARLHAATSGENRAYDVADKAFKIESWEYAGKKFGEFVQKYPKSSRVSDAILFQAMARYHLNHFDDTIALLSMNRSRAGIWEDEYLYWTAQAHFKKGNFQAAADVFAQLIERFRDSPRCLEAAVGQATAIGRLGEWPQVAGLLQKTNGVFREAATSATPDEFVARGYMLLGEAELVLKNFTAAQDALESMGGQTFNRELMWRREYLRCRLELAKGRTNEALENTGDLLALAGAPVPAQGGTNAAPAQPDAPWPDEQTPAAGLLAESWSFRASILEELTRFDDAIAAYTNNIVTSAPVDQQRHALFKIAELNLARNRYALATKALEDYLNDHGESGAADMALLTIGELQLKQAGFANTNSLRNTLAGATLTNLVQQALARFDALLTAFPSSPLAGKALLDKGWCLWTDGKYAQSEEAFRLAAERLPFSEDQAVARFKWADSQFMLRDFAGAAMNYNFVVTQYSSLEAVKQQLFELALYQTVRAALSGDVAAAGGAMRAILDSYPNGFAGPHCLLLMGQKFAQQSDPAGARELFAEFEKRYPAHPLLPEVRLAVARSYEEERNWQAAVGQYTGWIQRFTNQAELPRAEFYRALDSFKAGQETNAFGLFTNFIARFPTNELARDAQWWIGDYYFGRGQFQDAEKNYQWVYKSTNWAPSELTFQAQLMAGQAAAARFKYEDAFTYFTNLAANPACPLDLRIQASYDSGDALMARNDSSATNRPADLQEAVSWFNSIPQSYPNHPLAPLALGSMGNCYLQLGEWDPTFYDKGSNAYQRVINSPQAQIAARSQAGIGLGLVAEARAKLNGADEEKHTALLQQALENYLDVMFYKNNLRDGEQPDPFWVKKAGIEAGRLAETLHQWQQAIIIYQKLEDWLPQMRPMLEKKILSAQKTVALEKRQTGGLTVP